VIAIVALDDVESAQPQQFVADAVTVLVCSV
jgi:hypothetical protein